MSAKPIREGQGKSLLAKYLTVLKTENDTGSTLQFPVKSVTVQPKTDLSQVSNENRWLEKEVHLVTYIYTKLGKALQTLF